MRPGCQSLLFQLALAVRTLVCCEPVGERDRRLLDDLSSQDAVQSPRNWYRGVQ